jgi:putative DNA primase/helicase
VSAAVRVERECPDCYRLTSWEPDRRNETLVCSGCGRAEPTHPTDPAPPVPAPASRPPAAEPKVEPDGGALVVASPSDPMTVARQFLEARFAGADGPPLLVYHRGEFHYWSGTCWPAAEDRGVRADLYRWLERAFCWKPTKDEPELVPFEPTRYKVANVLEALQAIVHFDAEIAAPTWLDGREQPPADRIVAMANGLLDLRTRELSPRTPAFYSTHSLPFGFDPDAPTPKRWSRFLRELWPDDDESSETLAEIMGYVLSGDTRQQKMFLAVGPKRSGKGTIGRVLTGLLGTHNTAAPTLSGLTTNFGLAPLVGKPLAVISDARLGTRVDSMIAVERLLSISGEDTLTIDRKYLEAWTGRLPTRFLILTNEIPKFTDSSGALASRFVMLILDRSFYGREDPTLTEQLLAEASGIFNWALEGLDRLLDRGYFVQPESAREAFRHLEDLSSPIGAFVRDLCVVGPAYDVDKNVLYAAWKAWCEEEGRRRPGTKAVFVRDLRAAVPGVTPVRPRDGDRRRRLLHGIDLAENHPGRDGPGWAENTPARARTTSAEFPAYSGVDPGPPRPSGDPGRGPGRDRTRKESRNDAGGPGWSGVESTDFGDDVDEDELERLAKLSRRAQREIGIDVDEGGGKA